MDSVEAKALSGRSSSSRIRKPVLPGENTTIRLTRASLLFDVWVK